MDHTAPKQRINAIFAKYKYPILILLVGLGLMLLPERKTPAPAPVPVETAAQTSLEERLEGILSQIEGAGRVQVLLTEQTGRETLYQTDRTEDLSDAATRRTEDTC